MVGWVDGLVDDEEVVVGGVDPTVLVGDVVVDDVGVVDEDEVVEGDVAGESDITDTVPSPKLVTSISPLPLS